MRTRLICFAELEVLAVVGRFCSQSLSDLSSVEVS